MPDNEHRDDCSQPNFGSATFDCTAEGAHAIFVAEDEIPREVTVFVRPCKGGTVDVVAGAPRPKVGEDPSHPAQAKRVSASGPMTVIVRGVTVGITCRGGESGGCHYRIVGIGPK